jgi:hypothetical protein
MLLQTALEVQAVIPSLWWLYAMFQRDQRHEETMTDR